MQAAALSAVEIAYKFTLGKLSATEIVHSHLSAIDETDAQIKAWEIVDKDALKAQAQTAQTGLALSGVPVGIKDIIDCGGLPCRWGSLLYQDRIAKQDAKIIQLLRQAGALILGKTRTTEFAYLQHCETRNPHHHLYSPGGSSSGSAAGVAAGHMPVALGSQTGGSVIRPASYCGVFGFKPSFDAISREGVLQTSQTLDHVGIFARYLEDIALLGDVLMPKQNGHLMKAATTSPKQAPQFIWDEKLLSDQIEPYALSPLIQLASICAEHMHTDALASNIQSYNNAHSVVYDVEYAQNIGPLIEKNPSLASGFTQETVKRGAKIGSADFHAALNIRELAIAFFDEKLGQNTYMLLPSATSQAPLFERGTGNPACSKFTSFCGLPALSIPKLTGIALKGPDGLPLGVQIVGRFGNDEGVISAARWLAEYCASQD